MGASISIIDSSAHSTINASTHSEDVSEDEYLDADSTSTDLPPSLKKKATSLWAHATVSII